MGQPGIELKSEGFTRQPHEFVDDIDGFAPASGISHAIALTAYVHDLPVVFEQSVEQPLEVSDRGISVHTSTHQLTADTVDVAVGPGPARRLRRKDGTMLLTEDEERTLLDDHRMVFGQDQWKHRVRGPRVLVYGGGATAAWNVAYARKAGAEVTWVARVPEGRATAREQRKIEDIQRYLDQHGAALATSNPARKRWLERTLVRLLAFRGADLPRNRDVFGDDGVTWMQGEVQQLRPQGEGVEVELARGASPEVHVFDQVVISIGQDPTAPGACAALVKRLSMTWLEHDGTRSRPGDRGDVPRGRVVGACEVGDPPRVRCLGVLLAGGGWRYMLTRGRVGGRSHDLEAQLADQLEAAPTHSRGIEGAVFQIGVNVVLANGGTLDAERRELIASSYP